MMDVKDIDEAMELRRAAVERIESIAVLDFISAVEREEFERYIELIQNNAPDAETDPLFDGVLKALLICSQNYKSWENLDVFDDGRVSVCDPAERIHFLCLSDTKEMKDLWAKAGRPFNALDIGSAFSKDVASRAGPAGDVAELKKLLLYCSFYFMAVTRGEAAAAFEDISKLTEEIQEGAVETLVLEGKLREAKGELRQSKKRLVVVACVSAAALLTVLASDIRKAFNDEGEQDVDVSNDAAPLQIEGATQPLPEFIPD